MIQNDSLRKSQQLKLPKLKARQELIQALPSLKKYLGNASDEVAKRLQQPSPSSLLFYDSDEEREEEAKRLQEDLRRAKQEQATLQHSLSQIRLDQTSNDLQTEDIRLLRESLFQKQDMLNDLRNRNSQLEEKLEQMDMEFRDCQFLIPNEEEHSAEAEEMAKKLHLIDEMTMEMQSRQEQYRLLQDRTRNDRNASQHRMHTIRDTCNAIKEDIHTLTQYYHEVHAAKEASEKQLGLAVATLDQSRNDWQRKLRDKRKEVHQIEKRLAAEANEEAMKHVAAAKRAEQERLLHEQEHQQQKLLRAEKNDAALVEHCRQLEDTWMRFKGLAGTGATTAEHVIACWKDLCDRAEALQDLLRLTRCREDQQPVPPPACIPPSVLATMDGHTDQSASKGTSVKNSNATGDEYNHDTEQLRAAAELSLIVIQSRAARLVQRCTAPPTITDKDADEKADIIDDARFTADKGKKKSSVVLHRLSALMPRRISAIDASRAAAAAASKAANTDNQVYQLHAVPAVQLLTRPDHDDDSNDGPISSEDVIKDIHHHLDSIIPLLPGIFLETKPKEKKMQNSSIPPSQNKAAADALNTTATALVNDTNNTAGQAQNVNNAAIIDMHIKRLVGTAMEPSSSPSSLNNDPFLLESSDEDDGRTNHGDSRRGRAVVMDRAAIKHRSYKVTHPKQQQGQASPVPPPAPPSSPCPK